MSYLYEKHLKKRSGSNYNNAYEDTELWWWTSATGDQLYSTTSQLKSVNNRSFVGWDIPDYHRKLRTGKIMPHTPWKSLSITGACSGTFDMWTNSFTQHWWGEPNYCSYTGWLISEAELATAAPVLNDVYVQMAAAKIYDTGYDALTSLAELYQLKHMIKGASETMLRLRYPKQWVSSRVLSCEWLAYRYGWRILMYDIQNIIDVINNWNEKCDRYQQNSGTTWSNTENVVNEYEKSAYYLDESVKTVTTTSMRGSVTADIIVPRLQFNPLQTGWELIPFSFVVDWIINIGKTLSAMSFLALQTNYAASMGYRVEMSRTYQLTLGRTKANYSSGTREQVGSCVASLELRRPCRVPINPQLVVRLDPYKITDLLALLAQRFKRR